MANANKIVLGSGKLYIMPATKNASGHYDIPEDATFEVDANILGCIKGGATISYTPTFTTVTDDLGCHKKTFLTEEEAKFTSGILTWNMETLSKLQTACEYTEDTTAGVRILKLGGIGRFDGSQWMLRFVHEDAEQGDIRVTIVGSQTGGFELQFQPESESVVNAEFTAVPSDDEGTLVIFKETIV